LHPILVVGEDIARADATRTDEDLMLKLAHGRHESVGSLYSRHSRLVSYLALPAGAHASYRGRAGSKLAVLTAEGLPRPSDGKIYQAWVLQGDQWTSLGTFMPDADGTARVIAENSALARLSHRSRLPSSGQMISG
jgi:hypothetical protein